MTETTSSAWVGDSGSRTSKAASAKWRQRLVEGEVVLRARAADLDGAAVGGRRRDAVAAHRSPAGSCRSVMARRDSRAWPRAVSWLSRSRWLRAAHRVARALDDVEDHRVVDPHPRDQRLGLGGDELVVGLLGPRHLAVGGLAALHLLALLRVVAGLGDGAGVVDDVLGGLHDDRAAGVEPGPAGAPGDLVELARLEHPLARPVELHQPGEQHRADRHVDADAEGVGAADDLEQAVLGELLDQPAVPRQHPRVVHADAGRGPGSTGCARSPAVNRKPPIRSAMAARSALTRALEGHQRLGLLERRCLGEVHDVDRRLVGREQLLDGLGQGRQRPA